jgi:hypothetical protein
MAAFKQLGALVGSAVLALALFVANSSLQLQVAHADCLFGFLPPCSLNTAGTGCPQGQMLDSDGNCEISGAVVKVSPTPAPGGTGSVVAFPSFDPRGSCQLSNLKVEAQQGRAQYFFNLQCLSPMGSKRLFVAANFDPASRQTRELISSDSAFFTSEWKCGQDVWAFGGGCTSLTQTNPEGAASDPIFGLDLTHLGGPVSAQVLTNAQHQQLAQAFFQANTVPFPTAGH